jgi:hypothetical protein
MISRRSLTCTSRPRLQKRTMSMRSLVIGATLLFAGCAGMQMATTEASAQNACEPTITSTTEPCGGPLLRSVAVVTNDCSCNVDAYLTYKGPGGTAVVTNVPLGGGTRSHKLDCRLEPITFSLARSSFHCPRNTKVAPLSKEQKPVQRSSSPPPQQREVAPAPQRSAAPPQDTQSNPSSGTDAQRQQGFSPCFAAVISQLEAQHAICRTLVGRRAPEAQINACRERGRQIGFDGEIACHRQWPN